MYKIPKKIIAFENGDKKKHESWYRRRDPLNFPGPFRMCLFGPPNRGKTTMILNIILRCNPKFKKIYIMHPDKESRDFEDLENAEYIDNVPAPDDPLFAGDDKRLFIIDDIDTNKFGKDEGSNFNRLFGYISTHKNISLMLTCQNSFQILPIVRRCCNIYVLWKNPDMDSMRTLGRQCGYNKDKFDSLMDLLTDTHDSLMIDMTPHSPYPLRKNGYEIINIE